MSLQVNSPDPNLRLNTIRANIFILAIIFPLLLEEQLLIKIAIGVYCKSGPYISESIH